MKTVRRLRRWTQIPTCWRSGGFSPQLRHRLPICANLRNLRTATSAPLPLKQRFAGLVRGHERLRAAQRESLRQAEHLFQSLLHRAFEGAEEMERRA
jgi:hypothetical protein